MENSNRKKTGNQPAGPGITTSPRFKAALAFAATAAFCWLIYGVARRIMGHGGEVDMNRRYRDFLEFYSGAKAMLTGGNIYKAGYLGYIYPPLLAFLMAPLAMLPISEAAWIWLAIKTLLLAACGWFGAIEVQRRLNRPSDWPAVMLTFVAGMLLDFDKIRTEMNMQQTNLLVLLCFVLALRWLDKRPLLSGAAIGLGANIKYVTLIAIPYLLLRRRFRAAAASAGWTVIWALVPAASVGWSENIRLLKGALGGLANLKTANSAAGGAARIQGPAFGQSLSSFAVRYFGSGRQDLESLAVLAALALIFFMVNWFVYRRAGVPFFAGRGGEREKQGIMRGVTALEWAGLVVVVLAFGPQTNSPHLSMLLLICMTAVAVLMAPSRSVPGKPLIIGLVLMVGALVLPPGGIGLNRAVDFWRNCFGIVWCVLAMYVTLLWVGLRRLKEYAGPPEQPGGNE
ncbi:MAG: glycosyltransferase family 87 protein [Actinomycetota bacterium]|nr:glycosyltransferase family 87 protein [Actinomycetota bacterium]